MREREGGRVGRGGVRERAGEGEEGERGRESGDEGGRGV